MCEKGTISIESTRKGYLSVKNVIYKGKGLELEAEHIILFFQDISLRQGVVLDLQCSNIRDS